MTGGLMQLVNKGAQDVLVTGNPEDAKRELAGVGASEVRVIAKPDIISPLMEAAQQVMQGSFPVAKRGDVVTTNTPADANIGPPRFGASSVLDKARPGDLWVCMCRGRLFCLR